MKLLFLVTLIVFSSAEFIKKYPSGTYIKSCSEIDVDANKLCAYATYFGDFQKQYKNWNCIIFDECSYIINDDGNLVDKRISNCNPNKKISIIDEKFNILENKINLILKYINLDNSVPNLDKSVLNLGQDKKHKELEDFSL
jgi:hypothetical protein